MLGSAPLGAIPLGAEPTRAASGSSNPPFTNAARTAAFVAIVAAWQPPDPQPYFGAGQALGQRKLNPSITAVPVNDPPYQHRAQTPAQRAIIAMLQPDPWTYDYGGAQPYSARRLSPGIPGQSVDNPPVRIAASAFATGQQRLVSAIAQPDPWTYAYAGAQPYAPKQLSPGIPGQSIDAPPSRSPGRTIAQVAIAAQLAQFEWRGDAWTYAFAGAAQPYAPRRQSPAIPGLSVDKPPFDRRHLELAMSAVLTWQPPPPQPWVPRFHVKFVPGFTQVVIIG